MMTRPAAFYQKANDKNGGNVSPISLQRSKNESLSINSPFSFSFSFSKFIKYETQNLMKRMDTGSLSGNEQMPSGMQEKRKFGEGRGIAFRAMKRKG